MSRVKTSLDELKINRPPPSQERSRGWIVWIILLLAAITALAFFWQSRNRPLEVRVVTARQVTSGPAADRTILNASGYVTPRREATISSKVTGKVLEVMVEEGMLVKEGQIVARLDDTNIKASLALAEAQLKATQAALAETRVRINQAGRDLQRIRNLLSAGIATTADSEKAEAEEQALRARLAQQESQVTVEEQQTALWRQQMDDTIIRAPFAGIVTSKNAQPGEMISPVSAGGGFTRTGICTIVDMDSLEIEIDVNESYINRVTPGQPVEAMLDAYAQWKIPCKVIAIIPTADRQKSTVRVRVGFDKLDPRILPQMSVKVGFHDAGGAKSSIPSGGVIVPKGAIQRQGSRDVVMVVANGRTERRAVTVAEVIGEDALLASGLVVGECVALDWPPELADGTKVREKRN